MALNMVDYNLLLEKLAANDIVGGPHQLFSSCLTRREQYCQIGGQTTNRKVKKYRIRNIRSSAACRMITHLFNMIAHPEQYDNPKCSIGLSIPLGA